MKEPSEKRVVITGVGVVSSIGIGKHAFWAGLMNGQCGIAPITLFDATGLKTTLSGEIRNFDPADHLDQKGLKYLNRSTLLALVAGALACEDAGTKGASREADSTGLVMGVSSGHLESVSQIMSAVKTDPSWVSPMQGPNAAVNIITSHLAMQSKTAAFNTTIANGYTAGLEAIIYGFNRIKDGTATMVMAGGVESLSYENFLGLYRTNKLSRSDSGKREISAPFDRRRNGFVYGEGSAVLMLEESGHARDRGATIYGEVSGYGKSYNSCLNEAGQTEGACRAMERAANNARLRMEAIDYISANGNSSIELDRAESKAIRHVADTVPVGSIKGSIGECCSAAGSLQTAAALGMLHSGVVFPMINYAEPDPDCLLHFVQEKKAVPIEHVMVNSFSMEGNKASLVLSRVR